MARSSRSWPRLSIGSEEWQRPWRRESRLLARVRRAAWRRKMAELERTWAIASAHAEDVSVRKIAAAAGLGPTRAHAIVRDGDIGSLDACAGGAALAVLLAGTGGSRRQPR